MVASQTSIRHVLCSSAGSAPRAQPVSSKPAAPKLLKQLGAAAGAGLLSSSAAPSAGAYEAASSPAFSPANLPELPSITLPAVDIPDVSGLLDGADPLLIAGALAAVAIPAGLALLLGGGGNKGPKAKPVPAARALEALAADEACVLLDIRSKADIKATGAPNLKGVSRRGAVSVPYVISVKGEELVDPEFALKVAKVKGIDNAPVILLDSEGAEASAAAKAILEDLTIDTLYYVQGGAAAWQAAECPWREPGKGLAFELPDFSTAAQTIAGGVSKVAEGVADAPEAAKGALLVAGVVGASAVLFTQLELLFELAGVLAAGQFLLKVMFAEDREKTLTEIKKVVDEVDIPDLPQDLSKITNALLEDPTASSTEIRRAQQAAAAAVAAAGSAKGAPTPAPAPAPAAVVPPAAVASNGAEAPVEVSASAEQAA